MSLDRNRDAIKAKLNLLQDSLGQNSAPLTKTTCFGLHKTKVRWNDLEQWKTRISQSLIKIERKAQKLLGFCCDPCCQHRWTFTYVKDLQWGHRHLGYIKQLSFHLGSALMGCCRDTVLFHAFHLFILVVLFLLKKKKTCYLTVWSFR